MIDPYNQTSLANLTAAANAAQTAMNNNITSCAGAPGVEPFCSDTNGILLSVDWCRFQGYPDASAPTSASGLPDLSCHYLLKLDPDGSTSHYVLSGEDDHFCAGTVSAPSYDTCSGSDLLTALNDIRTINRLRRQGGLTTIQLSIGLKTGVYTPEFYMLQQNTGNTVPLSITFKNSTGNNATALFCGLEPQPWFTSYIAVYEAAYDDLLSFVHQTMTAGIMRTNDQSHITLVKVTPLNATTLEYFLPGLDTQQPTLEDPPKTPGDDVPISCTTKPEGAHAWTNNYSLTQVNSGFSLIQALEQTFGTAVGYLYATLQRIGEAQAFLSVATNDGASYPQIQCNDLYGDGPCKTQTLLGDSWSTYWLVYHVDDLFTANSIARNAAIAAASPFTFALSPANFYVNTTNLQDPSRACGGFPSNGACQAVSLASLSCDLNATPSNPNTQPGVFQLNGMAKSIPGVGTQLGIQTMYNLDRVQNPDGTVTDYCTTPNTPNLGQILNYGVQNGAQFIELTPDIAFDSTCQPAFAAALASFPNTLNIDCLY